MRYLGVALGQSIALGTCAGPGTIMGPVLLNIFFPEMNALSSLTFSVILGVVVTLVGIAIIGIAGSMKAASLSEEEKKAAVKDFNFPKGLAIALLAGFMSGCFNVGLALRQRHSFRQFHSGHVQDTPCHFLRDTGRFCNQCHLLFLSEYQESYLGMTTGIRKYGATTLLFCALAGGLWYSQFFGLSLGKGFLTESPVLTTLSFCILMALNVVFSNVWGIILKEWKGCSGKTIGVLLVGILVLIVSCFLPQLI